MIPRTTLYFDGGHYLDSCHQIFIAFRDLLHGVATKTTAESVAFYLLLDGPVLPIVAAIAFAIQGKVPEPSEWFVLVQLQCLFQALAATSIYYLARNLTGRKSAGVTAGLLWAVYPATIASCGAFLTEPLACCLLVLAAATLHRTIVSGCNFGIMAISEKILAGIVICALVLLKPALIPAAALMLILSVLCCSMRKRAIAGLLIVVLGGFLALAPWLWFTYYATGKCTVLPSRRPVYNIATGLNIESDGWGCCPTHPVTAMYSEDDSGAAVAAGFFLSNPADVSNMLLRKVTRLWSYPWNDFRYKVLGLSFKLQSAVQSLIIFLALTGAVLFASLAVVRRNFSRSQMFISVTAISVIATHLAYLPFEGIARYGFTAMPFVVLLAVVVCFRMTQSRVPLSLICAWAASLFLAVFATRSDFVPYFAAAASGGVFCDLVAKILTIVLFAAMSERMLRGCLVSGEQSTSAEKVLQALSVTFCLTGIAILAAFSSSDHYAKQWLCPLRPGMSAIRRVTVNLADEKQGRKPDWALVLVDGAGDVTNGVVSVNGVSTAPLESVYQFYGRKYELQNYIGMFANLLRQSPEKLRQWRAVEIDPGVLRNGSTNEIRLTATAKGRVTVYGDYLSGHSSGLYLPSFDVISPGKLFNGDDDDLDCRMMQKFGVRQSDTVCFLNNGSQSQQNDLSTRPGIQNGDYRMFIVVGYKQTPGSSAPTADSFVQGENHSPVAGRQKESLFQGRENSRTNHLLPPSSPGQPDSCQPAAAGNASKAFSANIQPAAFLQDQSNVTADHEFVLPAAGSPHRAYIQIPSSALNGSHVEVIISGMVRSRGAASTTLAVAGVLQTGDKQDLASILPGSPSLVAVDPVKTASFKVSAQVPSGTLKGTHPTIVVELCPADDVYCGKLRLMVRPLDRANFEGHAAKFF